MEPDDTNVSPESEMPQDAAQYLSEMKREALGVLFPNPNELRKRIGLITRYRGKSPNIYLAYGALAEIEILDAIEKRRKIRWDIINPVNFIESRAPSLDGRGRKEAVEIARATPTENRHSIIDILRGR